MTMVNRVMPYNLFKQLNIMWCHVISKTIICNDHVDLHFK